MERDCLIYNNISRNSSPVTENPVPITEDLKKFGTTTFFEGHDILMANIYAQWSSDYGWSFAFDSWQ